MSLTADLEARRRASVAATETARTTGQSRERGNFLEPMALIPASQLPRRHSSVTPVITTPEPPIIPQVIQTQERTPPAVPVRSRKPSTDTDDLVAPSTCTLQTNPFIYGANNPFLEHIFPKPVAPVAPMVPPTVVPPAIPPPPARYRRDSNAPSRRSSSVYLDTAPPSRRSSTASTDHCTPHHTDQLVEPKLPPQPTIILPNNYYELQRQSLLSKRNSCCHTEGHEPVIEEKPDKAACSSGSGSRGSVRQDSNVSSDSVSQTSSPSYTTKTMETPLLLNHVRKISQKSNHHCDVPATDSNSVNNSALTKSISTPASLQTCVKFSTGSNMTLQHRIIRDIRRPSTNYSRGRLRFRYIQVMINAVALIVITGGLLAYFESHPGVVRVVNNTITNTVALVAPEANPSPGFCLKLIVKVCINRVPYNFTSFPNHAVNFNQMQAEQELEIYDALVDVRCYELSSLFLCAAFVPKCGPSGNILYPCKSLCEETKRRCGFFLEVFGLKSLPDYLTHCKFLPDSDDPDECVGYKEVQEARLRSEKPNCSKDGFLCDHKRCIPLDWKCDGHLDCQDETDEKDCNDCPAKMVHCGEKQCINSSHICDGKRDCPYAQDERNCLRLQGRMGDIGSGQLQVYNPEGDGWVPACISTWDSENSPQIICKLLGYREGNTTRITFKGSNVPLESTHTANLTGMESINFIKEFRSCERSYPVVRLECRNYECGKRRTQMMASKRIVGGYRSQPGDWPFLAALLGGPEEIFYCAGVLIADQWVLTASHCAGNFSEASLDGWRIQLGITRRHSHNFYGQKVQVKKVIPHPLHNVGVNHDNDIALFQLKERVNFNEHLLPVCLPPPGRELVPGTNCTVIGWGKSEDLESSEYEPAVNEVTVPVINRELCNKWMIYKDLNVTDGMICAGLAEGGKDACQGDSGGPLLCPLGDDRWFVGGIVSWGIKCANPHLPGVYAYVPKYVPWIREQMELHSD